MKDRRILKKMLAALLILTLSLSNVSVAAGNEGTEANSTGTESTLSDDGAGAESRTAAGEDAASTENEVSEGSPDQDGAPVPSGDGTDAGGSESGTSDSSGSSIELTESNGSGTESSEGSESSTEPEEGSGTEPTEGSESDIGTTENTGSAEGSETDVSGDEGSEEPPKAGETETVPADNQGSETTPGEDSAAVTAPAEDEVAEQLPEEEKEEPKAEYQTALSPEELEELGDEEAGISVWWDAENTSVQPRRMARSYKSSAYDFSAYYVNQSDLYQVEKTEDFSLKYQMKFHSNTDFEEKTVRIRIPAMLFCYRAEDGTPTGDAVMPYDIPIPRVENEDESKEGSSPFNYYIDTNGDLVFFNYAKIDSGINIAWQVLYKNIEIMKTVDETSWSLQPEFYIGEEKQELGLAPLTGNVNSTATITSLKKTQYAEFGRSCTPGLYTRDQVKEYIDGELPKYFDDHFEEYKYVVWEVEAKGTATQPWTLKLTDKPFITLDEEAETEEGRYRTGAVVGFRNNLSAVQGFDTAVGRLETPALEWQSDTEPEETESWPADGAGYVGTGDYAVGRNEKTFWGVRFYVVTAYPKEGIQEATETSEATVLENTLTAEIIPCDGKDTGAEWQREDSSQWDYVDYDWNYEGELLSILNKNGRNEPDYKDGTKYRKKYTGWLNAYSYAAKNGLDYGNLPCYTKGVFRGYHLTHDTGETADGSVSLGEYRPGTKYELTTVDDFLYVGGNNEKNQQLLDGSDYYYSSLTVRQTDVGYDVWEDRTTKPEADPAVAYKGADIDPKVYVYLMYEGETQWPSRPSLTIDWNESGVMEQTWGTEELRRADGAMPWRVMVRHETAEYSTTCEIEGTVCAKKDSAKLQALASAQAAQMGKPETVELEHLSGVIGRNYQNGSWSVLSETNGTNGKYSDASFKSAVENLYLGTVYGKILPYRDHAFKQITKLGQEARAFKTSSRKNDADNSRVLVEYILTAYEGYQISREEELNYIRRDADVPSPGRNEVVFYDLLPYGMQFYPTAGVEAGRIVSLYNNDYQTKSGSWDKSQVQVTVGPEDVDTNYEGTGRTMVRFHIRYPDGDPSLYTDGRWLSGWGLKFTAYYDTKDQGLFDDDENSPGNANICAFMPENAEPGKEELLGTEDYVAKEGELPAAMTAADRKYYQDLAGRDINGNPDDNDRRHVLYAHNLLDDDLAVISISGIKKGVRAVADDLDGYRDSAAAAVGEAYEYDITVKSEEGRLKNIILYDHLENAVYDVETYQDEKGTVGSAETFDAKTWQGTFASVNTKGLDTWGIDYKIYYSTDREAAPAEFAAGVPVWDSSVWKEYTEDTEADLTKAGGSLADIKSIAVDLCTKKDGSAFELPAGQSVGFRIRMTAPAEMLADAVAKYSYNSPLYDSTGVSQNANGEDVEQRNGVRRGGAVKVSLTEGREVLEVIKEVANLSDVPEDSRNTSFDFQIKDAEGKTYGTKQYRLYAKSGGGWKEQTDRVYTTSSTGHFSLKADERAVFSNVIDAEGMTVTETPNVFWNSTEKEPVVWPAGTDGEGNPTPKTVVRTISNEFRRVLYVKKTVAGVPDSIREDTDRAVDSFLFTVEKKSGGLLKRIADFFTGTDGYELINGLNYYYVDQVRTDGGIPNIIEVDGKKGGIITDGKVSLRENEIIAIVLDNSEAVYRVREELTGEASDRWSCEENTWEGKVPLKGVSAEITNYYRWKDLYLTKEITNRPNTGIADRYANDFFTFQIKKLEGGKQVLLSAEEAARLTCVIPDENGNYTGGAIREVLIDTTETKRGSFTFNCPDGLTKMRISGLEAGVTYVVKETESGELYQPVNDTIEVAMPIYGGSRTERIVNDYLLRSLAVTKTVTGAVNEFEEKVEDVFDENGDWINTIYTQIDKRPAFTMTLKMYKDGSGVPETGEHRYMLLESGETESEVFLDTHDQGQFELKNGQTAVFMEAGKEGDRYEVVETQNGEYPQIYPEITPENPQGAQSGKLSEDSRIGFVNGSPGALYLKKEYIIHEDTMNDAVMFFNDTMTDEDLASLFREAVMPKGEVYIRDTPVTLDIKKDGIVSTILGGADNIKAPAGTERMFDDGHRESYDGYRLPYQSTLILPNLDPDTQYSLKEQYTDQIFMFRGTVVTVRQIYPEDNQPAAGTVGTDPMAVIRNEVRGHMVQSAIGKQMTPDSSEIPEGAQLVYRVEQYDGTKWTPAKDVEYITLDGCGMWNSSVSDISCDRILKTGEDGLIYLSKGNYYPWVCFMEEVYLNLYQGMEQGDYRIVEVPEKSDKVWGTLSGYHKYEQGWYETSVPDSNYSMDMEPSTYGIFVNSNQMLPVEVEKKMEIRTKETFRMILQQVLSTSGFPLDENGEIQYQEPRSGIAYTLYDSESGEPLGEGVTEDDGAIVLSAGQYARLNLPYDTFWTVSEAGKDTYDLKEMTGEDGNVLTKLGVNQMLIYHMPSEGEITITADEVRNGVIDAETGERVSLSSGKVNIPAYILRNGRQKCKVTGIGVSAFAGNSDVTEVIIPDTVTRIEACAFDSCENLKSVEIPSSVRKIGSSAFSCSGLTKVVIPQSIRDISESVFNTCYNLESVELSSGLKTIGASAFANCINLRTIEIPETVTKIDRFAFQESGLERVTVPNGIQTIDMGTFDSCQYLVGVTLPSGLKRIENNAFAYCGSLKTIQIPATVSEILQAAFIESGLTELVIDANNSIDIKAGAFNNCSNLKKVTIKAPQVNMEAPFYGCSSLEEFTLETTGTGSQQVDVNHLADCKKLSRLSVKAPEISIRGWQFYCHPSLSELTLTAQSISISDYAFQGCPALRTVTLDGNGGVESYAFENCSVLNEVAVNVDSIGQNAFSYSEVNKAVIGSRVMEIGNYAFSRCTELSDLDFQDGEQPLQIGEEAFAMTGISNLTIPSRVSSIGRFAFTQCNQLTGVMMEDKEGAGPLEMKEKAFDGDTSLKWIVFPERIEMEMLPMNYLHDCSALQKIYINAENSYAGVEASKVKELFGVTDSSAQVVILDAGELPPELAAQP